MDKDQNIIVYINVHSLKKRILQDNKGFIITMKGTYEKSFERFNSTKVQNSSIPSLSSKPNKFKMHPWFVTGFTDGEGCFHISITKDKGKKVGWIIKLIFQISLH